MSKPKVERQVMYCKTCNKVIKHNPKETNERHNKRKYCSYECQSKKIIKNCKLCNKEYTIHLFRKYTSNFCSVDCRNEYYSIYNVQENSVNWNGGKSFEKYDFMFNRRLKKKIRERDKYTCQICKTTSEKIALDVHHIDYDKKNSSENNLVSLCHSCHSKIPNESKEWREYFDNYNR